MKRFWEYCFFSYFRDRKMTPTRTHSPVEISVRYARYAETYGFSSNGEMRYYYADGRVSNNKLPQVFIDRGNPSELAFSSFPMRGAGFYRIGDPSGQAGSFSSTFQYNVSNVDAGVVLDFVGFTSSICAENNVGIKYTIPQGISTFAYGLQMLDIGIDTYQNWPPSFENFFDLTITNIGFFGGPMGAYVAFTLGTHKRGLKWAAKYLSEFEMELRRMNSPQTYY